MSLRDRLRSRQLPSEVVRIPVDLGQHTQAQRELDQATWALDDARTRGSADLAELRARASYARAQMDTLDYELVTVRALPPAEWEVLVEMHQPTEEQRQGGAQWNLATFRLALLAASVVPSDGEEPLSEAEWEQAAKEGSVTVGELNMLFNAAVTLNVRSPESAVGKGSSAIPS